MNQLIKTENHPINCFSLFHSNSVAADLCEMLYGIAEFLLLLAIESKSAIMLWLPLMIFKLTRATWVLIEKWQLQFNECNSHTHLELSSQFISMTCWNAVNYLARMFYLFWYFTERDFSSHSLTHNTQQLPLIKKLFYWISNDDELIGKSTCSNMRQQKWKFLI